MKYWKLLVNTLREAAEDDLLDWAAALGFYFIFSLFPLMLLLASLLGLVHATGMMHQMIAGLVRVLPRPAAALVSRQLIMLVAVRRGGLFSLGTALLLYSGSQGFSGLMAALNIAYEVPETRPYWRRLLLALGLTLSAGLFTALGLALLLLGPKLFMPLIGVPTAGWWIHWVWPPVRWCVAFGLLVGAVVLLFHWAPNVDWRRRPLEATARPSSVRHGILPAAVAAMVLWITASLALAVYINNLSDYSAVYGSLGAVIALLLWFYLGALALLLGAEFHCEVLKLAGEHLRPRPRHARRAAANKTKN